MFHFVFNMARGGCFYKKAQSLLFFKFFITLIFLVITALFLKKQSEHSGTRHGTSRVLFLILLKADFLLRISSHTPYNAQSDRFRFQ